MNQTKRLTILLFFCSSFTVSAQFENFNLSDYKLPDIRTHRLDMNINLDNNINHSYTRDIQSNTDTIKDFDLSSVIKLDYSLFRHSENYRGYHRVTLNTYPRFNIHDQPPSRSSYIQIPAVLTVVLNNRFYHGGNFFFEVDPSLTADMSYRKADYKHLPDYNNSQSASNIMLNIPLSVGTGRIEPVENARHAVYILEEMEKNGRLKNMPSDDLIVEFARLISKLKYKRFFDARLKKIGELQVIDSFLVANNLVSENDIVYFTGLTDIWDYGYGPVRNTGRLVHGGINYSLSHLIEIESDHASDSDTTKKTVNTIGAFVSYQSAKPVNLHWQKDFDVRAAYDIEFTDDPQERTYVVNEYRTGILSGNIDYTIQYIPDTRTSGSVNAGCYIKSLHGDRGKELPPNTFTGRYTSTDLSAFIGASINYYISPQFRLNADWLSKYSYLKTKNSFSNGDIDDTVLKRFTNTITIRVTYSFF